MKQLILVTTLLFAGPGWAAHDWGGVDICQVRRDIMPPGIEPALLAEPAAAGAALLQRYCTQCHYLPGPGRHTAEEWPAVLERMDILMGVSRFYRGLLGPVDSPGEGERKLIRDYLQRHALRPLPASATLPADGTERLYRAVCGDCHAAPDPRRYAASRWPTLLERMDNHRTTMARPPLSSAQQEAVTGFIARAQGGPAVAGSGHQGMALPLPAASPTQTVALGRLVSLAAFFGLAGLGLWRWQRRGH